MLTFSSPLRNSASAGDRQTISCHHQRETDRQSAVINTNLRWWDADNSQSSWLLVQRSGRRVAGRLTASASAECTECTYTIHQTHHPTLIDNDIIRCTECTYTIKHTTPPSLTTISLGHIWLNVDVAYCHRLISVVCLSRSGALQKQLTRSRFHLGCGVGWPQGTMC